MPKLIIGREPVASNPRLRIQCEGKPDKMLSVNVPQYVSREHLAVEWDEEGVIQLSNLKADNRTMVGGKIITNCRLSALDTEVKLGMNPGFTIDLGQIITSYGYPCSIAHLERIWQDWNNSRIEEQIRERRFNAISSCTGIMGSLGMLCMFISGIDVSVRIVLGIISVLLIAVFGVLRYKKSEAPRQREILRRKFEKEYACPCCGFHFGNISFDQLKLIHNCKNCKAKFHC